MKIITATDNNIYTLYYLMNQGYISKVIDSIIRKPHLQIIYIKRIKINYMISKLVIVFAFVLALLDYFVTARLTCLDLIILLLVVVYNVHTKNFFVLSLNVMQNQTMRIICNDRPLASRFLQQQR